MNRKNNMKLIICFSAVPGSGKTFIAKELEKVFKAVRINNDELGRIILRVNKGTNNRKIMLDYLECLIKNNRFSNKLLILDSSIDRKYDLIKKIADSKGFKLLIIRIISDREVIIKRIRARDKDKSDEYIKEMPRWEYENYLLNKNVKADITIYNNKNQQLDLKALYSLINSNGKHKQKLVR